MINESPWLRSVPAACRWVLRGGEDVRAAAEAALGVQRPGAGLPRRGRGGARRPVAGSG